MNTQNTNLFSAISKEETIQLTTVVAETIALVTSEKKSFTAANLWNIQRQRRSFVQRRYNAA